VPYDLPTLEKQPSEGLLYDMEFLGRLAEGETLTAVTSFTAVPNIDTAPLDTPLTIGTPAASGTRAQARISAGTSGTKYKITVVVTTSASNTLEGEGYLFVRNS